MLEKNVRRLLVSYQAANAAGPTSAVARDAALGGLFIETTAPLPIGTLLSVELSAPAATVTLEGRVFSTKSTAEAGQAAGMGVRFLDLPASVLVRLQAILDHHRPPARTRLGVGDEREALWATAGGRDESDDSIEEDSLALSAAVEVEGRGTTEIPIAKEVPKPEPTPRMQDSPRAAPVAPATGWSTPGSVPPPGYGPPGGLVPGPSSGVPSYPPPSFGPPPASFQPPPSVARSSPNARRTSTLVVVFVLALAFGLLGLGVIGWIWATRLR